KIDNMRWKGRRQSSNVEDLRTSSGGRSVGFKGGIIGTLVVAAIVYFLGGDPLQVINLGQMNQTGTVTETELTAKDKEMGEFVAVVLADTEDVWNKLFSDMGKSYQEPKLVLFRGGVSSACGFAEDATGPFYCPGDEKIYIDLVFFDELEKRFDAPGDFAMAYVIAHEVGHHVQNQLGIIKQMEELRKTVSETEYNALSVRLELQADYLAGVWAFYVQGYGYLEEGDIDEALAAASAVGDDTIQKQSQGYVVPDSFTHGTSEQRMRWFRRGFQYGDLDHGDTFNATTLSIMK
ncbi:MAG: neutral zinc metallopeptidase, partial [Erysipelotrichaceae bacterium]|nr:neutral zinc metallopeptidase [Erysipelotrichaceae bacterium]